MTISIPARERAPYIQQVWVNRHLKDWIDAALSLATSQHRSLLQSPHTL